MTEVLDKSAIAREDDLSQFLRDIREFPRLTLEQERELARRCAEGDEDAIRQMVNSNLRLVVSVAREYSGRGVALMDLIQEGSIGLLAAARKFDYTRDVRFSTYATKWIRKGVSQCLLSHAGMIRVPIHTAERMRKIAAAHALLLQQTGIEPSVTEVAQMSGIQERKVLELLRMTPEVSSLDMPAGDSDDGSLYAVLEDEQISQPYAGLVRRELEHTMQQLLDTLSERQEQVLRLHFGMEDGKCYSLEEIGRKLGISKERTRQVERQAIEKLQKSGASLGLEDFLNE